MGMLNAGSTTYGLLAENHQMNPEKIKVVTMRSSDNSMSKYLSVSPKRNKDCIETNKRNLEMIGIKS
jgi:hypothetical protein